MMKKILILGSMLLSMILLAPGVFAGTTGTADISGNPSPFLDLTVNGSHSFEPMTVATHVNTTNNTVMTTVVSNEHWSVGASDTHTGAAGSPGQMAEWNATAGAWVSGGKYLSRSLEVSPQGTSWVTLDGTSRELFTGVVAGTVANYPWFRQTVVNEDQSLTDNTYKLVVTFTASTV